MLVTWYCNSGVAPQDILLFRTILIGLSLSILIYHQQSWWVNNAWFLQMNHLNWACWWDFPFTSCVVKCCQGLETCQENINPSCPKAQQSTDFSGSYSQCSVSKACESYDNTVDSFGCTVCRLSGTGWTTKQYQRTSLNTSKINPNLVQISNKSIKWMCRKLIFLQ